MSLLRPDHPSFSCNRAWFVFGVRTRPQDGIRKIMMVEATTRDAVHTLEWIAADGRVSPTCELLSVNRGEGMVGIRSDAVEEVPFEGFLRCMVDPARKAQLPAAPTPPPSVDSLVTSPSASAQTVLADAEAALCDLGFKKSQVRRMLDELGPEAGDMPIDKLLQACLRRSGPT